MNLSLSDRQNELIQLARDIASQEILPYVSGKDFTGNPDFDWHLIDKLREHNLVCPTIPEEYGGLGLDMFTTILVMEELAAASRGLGSIISANIHAVLPVLLSATEKHKAAVLPKLAGRKACLAAFAVTEPTGGSDTGAMNTFAEKDGDAFVINGRKDYIVNAPEAKIITLFAVTSMQRKKSSMRCFTVFRENKGVKLGKIHQIPAVNYARIAELNFNNVRVDADYVIKPDEPYSGYFLLNQTFGAGRVLNSACSVGIARAAYELAQKYADERIQFGRKIKRHQAIAHALAGMATKIEMARLMTWKAAWLIDNGDDYTIASAMAKLSASEIAQEVTSAAADILASRALEKDSVMEQLLREARAQSTIGGTNHIQRNLIAASL